MTKVKENFNKVQNMKRVGRIFMKYHYHQAVAVVLQARVGIAAAAAVEMVAVAR